MHSLRESDDSDPHPGDVYLHVDLIYDLRPGVKSQGSFLRASVPQERLPEASLVSFLVQALRWPD